MNAQQMKVRMGSRWAMVMAASVMGVLFQTGAVLGADSARERINFDDDWRFTKGDPEGMTANLTLLQIRGGGRGAAAVAGAQEVNEELWKYILPTANDFVKDPAKRVARPEGNPVEGVAYAEAGFNDGSWRQLDLPHDFGIEGPFVPPGSPNSNLANGGTGRLPFYGIAWYRKHLSVAAGDQGKQMYLDMDGAMAYAMVFVNGQLAGGWPYGYASWRLDMTPYLKPRRDNVLAIRLDNPAELLALVSRRRDLPQCVAGEDGAGACGAMGDVCHHAAGIGGVGDRWTWG